MYRKLSFLISFALLVTFGVTTLALGAPLPSGSLKVGTVIDIGKELVSSSSMYNPRSFGGKNYIVQINSPQRGVGCYPAGSAIYEALANIGDGTGLRMAGPFQAADYVLFSGDAGNDYFSRIDPNLNLDTQVFATNLDVRPSSYDWVDDDTIVHNSYKSGLRTNLYLTDVNPDPFQVTANTSWNANGYVTTGATTRIRNVRVGDIYSGYAYYGDAGTENAGFWAIDLATGVSTQLETLSVTGSGSWGLWTVKEVDGFLYVHTTHDGIYIYNMADATTLGTLHTRYTKDRLDALAEDTNPNWGFDVVDDGARMLLSAGLGRIIEIIDSRIAGPPNPANGAVDVKQTPILKWGAGDQAVSHQVYFGTDEEAVRSADTGSPEYIGTRELGSESYDPGKLEWDTSYYWRVDEVNNLNPESPWIGGIWSFTTANFLVVDDFESYNDLDPNDPGSNRIFNTWIDGWGVDTNGAEVGYANPDFLAGEHHVETTIVHGGSQSMPYFYDNDFKFSQADLPLSPPQDWTEEGVEVLSLWFHGDASNAAELMYVTVNGSAAVYHDDPNAAQIDTWMEWTIDLQAFADQGVDLTNVNTIALGFGDKNNLKAGGSGLVFFDDIRLYRPPADPSLVIYYSFDEVGDIVADQSGKGHDGVVVGDVTAEPDGKYNGAANFASGSYLDLDGPGFPAEDIPTSAMTLAAWIKIANTGGDHEIFSARASDGSWLIHPEPKSSGDIRWLLRSYGGTTIFQIRAGTVTWDEWLHFAGTYDKASGKAALYINGELIEEIDVASPADIAGDWGQGARVGLTIDNARPFTGLMDEFRMYTRALSQDEIQEIMQGM